MNRKFLLPDGHMAALVVLVFIITASVVTMYLPERIDTNCFTPDQQWVENGTRYRGNQVYCP